MRPIRRCLAPPALAVVAALVSSTLTSVGFRWQRLRGFRHPAAWAPRPVLFGARKFTSSTSVSVFMDLGYKCIFFITMTLFNYMVQYCSDIAIVYNNNNWVGNVENNITWRSVRTRWLAVQCLECLVTCVTLWPCLKQYSAVKSNFTKCVDY